MFTTSSVTASSSLFTKNRLSSLLAQSGLDLERQVPVPVWFRGQNVGQFRADIMVARMCIARVEDAPVLSRQPHEAQLLHYLKSTEIEIGLLLNFGPRPQFRRLLFDNERKKIRVNPCESVAEVYA